MTDPLRSHRHWIAVLGNPSHTDGTISPIQLRRCKTALSVYKTTDDAAVLVLGAAVKNDVVESETMARWLAENGVPESALWTEGETTSTRHQALLLVELFGEHWPASVTVVSDRTHLPRTKMLLARLGLRGNCLRFAGAPQNITAGFVVYETINYAKDFLWSFSQRLTQSGTKSRDCGQRY